MPTIYPPTSELLFALVRAAVPVDAAYWPLQATGLLLSIGITLLLIAGLRRRGLDPRWAALWALNPLVASEAVTNSHIDVLGALLALAAAFAVSSGARWRGGILLGAAVAAKLIPVLAAPALLRRQGWKVIAAAIATFAVLYIPYVATTGIGVLGYLPGYLNEEGYDSGSRFVLLRPFLPGPAALVVAAVLLVAVAVLVIVFSDPSRPWVGQVVMIGATLIIASPRYPWYALLLLPFIAMSGRWEWLAVPFALALHVVAPQHATFRWTLLARDPGDRGGVGVQGSASSNSPAESRTSVVTITQTAAALAIRPRRRALGAIRSSTATAPVAVGLFALVVAAAGSWIPSPWYDEAATISAATRTLPQLFALLQNVDAVHGVYYALMHVWLGVVGYSPFTLRLPSAVAVGLAAAALVVLVRRLAPGRRGRRTALVAGLVFALLPRVTWAGTEGRSYAISVLLAVTLTLVFLGAWGWGGRDRTQRALAWAAYGALAAIACATFLYLALLVLAHGVTAVLLARREGRRLGRPGLLGWALATAAAAAASLSLVIDEVQQSKQVDWIAPLSAATVKGVLVSQWFFENSRFAWVGWPLVILGIAVLLLRRAPGRLAAVTLPWMIVPPAALLLATAVATPLYSARYLTFGVPTVAILIAVALTAPRRTWITVAGLLLCLALTVPSYLHQRSDDGKQNSSWGQVAALLASERAAEPAGQVDAAIYGPLRKHPDADMAMIAQAYPTQFSGLIDLKLNQTGAERGRLWESRIPLADARSRLADAPSIWLITSDKRDWRPTVQVQLAAWGYRFDEQWHFDGINVVRYRRN